MVCGTLDAVTAVEVAGNSVALCVEHARRPDRAGRLRVEAVPAVASSPDSERRVAVDRRCEERRMFPPRPELRRNNDGRRDDDPRS